MKTIDLTSEGMTIEFFAPMNYYMVRDAEGKVCKGDGSLWRAFFWTDVDAYRYIQFCKREGRNVHADPDTRSAWDRIAAALVIA